MTEPQQFLDLSVPADQEVGTYAKLLAIWHTEDEFTLDFAVRQPPQQATAADGGTELPVPARVVSRVKVPPGQVSSRSSRPSMTT